MTEHALPGLATKSATHVLFRAFQTGSSKILGHAHSLSAIFLPKYFFSVIQNVEARLCRRLASRHTEVGIRVPNRALKRTPTDHAYDLTPNSNKDPLYATTSLLCLLVASFLCRIGGDVQDREQRPT